ncbi:hypothetical protein BDL97_08G106000 [Sphagnum fallax]|nr:hypothetical protein BDL97_08G105600 [Sphagnum fallax]KAH8954907.1 hypothetical protein BDL97_08G105900 [Sphagnum fallax]KAH8954908.1 hypothetical protein BDL97_08G106000 [Sphagnum fallax]
MGTGNLASGGISLTHSAGAVVIAVSTSRKAGAQLCAYPATRIRSYNWSVKAIWRKTTGTGCMWHLRDLPRRFKNNFREGSQAPPKVKAAAT